MRPYRAITLLLLVFAASLARADEKSECLFRGVVVPISAGEEAKSFVPRRDAGFSVRLRVTEIIVGKCPIVPGKDYIFGLHSMVLTFGTSSLKEVEGKEFIWFLSLVTLKDGTETARLDRGEELYESFKDDPKKKG